MTESRSTHPNKAPIVVRSVTAADPPFRVVEIKGEVVGKAYNVADVIEFVRRAGLEYADLDDPDIVNWIGGDQDTWA